MEKLKDILESIKERFTNPLFFSFICSWLVVNWQITVGLFWYDTKQIEKTGCNSIFEFITDKINLQDCLLHPLYFAIGYTFLMPTIRNVIRAFYSWTAKWGDNWNLNITKGVKIPFEKYLRFREDYDKRSKILEDVITKESTNLTELNNAKTELLQAQSTETELKQQLTESNNFVRQLNDVRMLNGYWTNKYTDTIDRSLIGTEEIYISEGKYYTVEKFGDRKHHFNITNFYFDNRSQTMFFIKERVNQEKAFSMESGIAMTRFNPNSLHVEREDLLIGVENGTTQIEYLKKATTSLPTKEETE